MNKLSAFLRAVLLSSAIALATSACVAVPVGSPPAAPVYASVGVEDSCWTFDECYWDSAYGYYGYGYPYYFGGIGFYGFYGYGGPWYGRGWYGYGYGRGYYGGRYGYGRGYYHGGYGGYGRYPHDPGRVSAQGFRGGGVRGGGFHGQGR